MQEVLPQLIHFSTTLVSETRTLCESSEQLCEHARMTRAWGRAASNHVKKLGQKVQVNLLSRVENCEIDGVCLEEMVCAMVCGIDALAHTVPRSSVMSTPSVKNSSSFKRCRRVVCPLAPLPTTTRSARYRT